MAQRSSRIKIGAESYALLCKQAEEPSISFNAVDFQAGLCKKPLVPMRGVAAVEMVRFLMQQRAERSGEQQAASGPQQAGQLAYRKNRLGDVLQHLGAQHYVKRRVRYRDLENIRLEIKWRVVPDGPGFLAKVVCTVLAVRSALGKGTRPAPTSSTREPAGVSFASSAIQVSRL